MFFFSFLFLFFLVFLQGGSRDLEGGEDVVAACVTAEEAVAERQRRGHEINLALGAGARLDVRSDEHAQVRPAARGKGSEAQTGSRDWLLEQKMSQEKGKEKVTPLGSLASSLMASIECTAGSRVAQLTMPQGQSCR